MYYFDATPLLNYIRIIKLETNKCVSILIQICKDHIVNKIHAAIENRLNWEALHSQEQSPNSFILKNELGSSNHSFGVLLSIGDHPPSEHSRRIDGDHSDNAWEITEQPFLIFEFGIVFKWVVYPKVYSSIEHWSYCKIGYPRIYSSESMLFYSFRQAFEDSRSIFINLVAQHYSGVVERIE